MSEAKFKELMLGLAIVQSHMHTINEDRTRVLKAMGGLKVAEEMYQALESTNKDLMWAINKLNDYIKDSYDYSSRSLDDPELIDMQTCHENAMLLAKARGEM